jgi:hypothetical protein
VHAYSLLFRDLDQDGTIDLAHFAFNLFGATLIEIDTYSIPNQTFVPAQTLSVPVLPNALAKFLHLGDFDGNGLQDLAFGPLPPGITVGFFMQTSPMVFQYVTGPQLSASGSGGVWLTAVSD